MGKRLPIAISSVALVVALLGSTPLGRAAIDAAIPPLAKRALSADTAKNALQVNKIKASRTPKPGTLLPLDATGKFPAFGRRGPVGPGRTGWAGRTRRREGRCRPVGCLRHPAGQCVIRERHGDGVEDRHGLVPRGDEGRGRRRGDPVQPDLSGHGGQADGRPLRVDGKRLQGNCERRVLGRRRIRDLREGRLTVRLRDDVAFGDAGTSPIIGAFEAPLLE